jgi:hypothetical protein
MTLSFVFIHDKIRKSLRYETETEVIFHTPLSTVNETQDGKLLGSGLSSPLGPSLIISTIHISFCVGVLLEMKKG